MLSYDIRYKYTAGGFKKIRYHFKDESEFDDFMEKEMKDEKIRKIIGHKKVES